MIIGVILGQKRSYGPIQGHVQKIRSKKVQGSQMRSLQAFKGHSIVGIQVFSLK